MGEILLTIILLFTCVSSILFPYVGVIAYYTLSIFYPQAIWPYIFTNVRAAYFVSIATMLGFLKGIIFGEVELSSLFSKQNIMISIIWISYVASYYLSPFGEANNARAALTDPKAMLDNINKIFLFYFIATTLISKRKQMHHLVIMFLSIIAYFTYWANYHYFSGQMRSWRLGGPGFLGGIYGDENSFALIFIMGIPFLFFMGSYYKWKPLKYTLWAMILLSWHAVFLTGSFGGLISLSIMMFFVIFRSKQKALMVVVPVCFALALIFQGGDYLKGKLSMGGGDIRQIETAQTRFDSWKAGIGMVRDYPLLGVGPGKFMTAYPKYSPNRPFVAHNTILQVSSEVGLTAGVMYILIFINALLCYRRNRKLFMNSQDRFMISVYDSVIGSMIGYFICALFLNLINFEVLYYVLILNLICIRIANREISFSSELLSHEINLSDKQNITKPLPLPSN